MRVSDEFEYELNNVVYEVNFQVDIFYDDEYDRECKNIHSLSVFDPEGNEVEDADILSEIQEECLDKEFEEYNNSTDYLSDIDYLFKKEA